MGSSAQRKHGRANRKQQRPTKLGADQSKASAQPKSTSDSRVSPKAYPIEPSHVLPDFSSSYGAKPVPSPDSGSSNCADWDFFTEEQMEEIMFKNLGFLYRKAAKELAAMGYSKDDALKALLRNGHCYGSNDALTNIMDSALFYLNGGGDSCAQQKNTDDDSAFGLADLRQLVDYTLAGMICLLKQVRPSMSRGDALWCLIMSDLHVGKASAMVVPDFPPPPTDGGGNAVTNTVKGTSGCMETDALCCPRCIWCEGIKEPPMKKDAAESSVSSEGASKGPAPVVNTPVERSEGSHDSKEQVVVDMMLEDFKNINLNEKLEEAYEEHKEEILAALVNQTKSMERKVKDRKDWAQQRAIQAARKLANDLIELKVLRMEREETQKLKMGKPTLDDITVKMLSVVENALRKVKGEVDRSNRAVMHLEMENAELRALTEGYNLDSSESAYACLQVEKRQKKLVKKLMNQEKQKEKFLEEIAAEKRKITELRKLLGEVNEAGKEAKTKWMNEVVAKEQAMVQLEEEKRAMEETRANNRRRLEALKAKIKFDFQRHRDDLQRLEQELSHLKATSESNKKDTPDSLPIENSEATRSTEQAKVAKLYNELSIHHSNFPKWEINRGHRDCVNCGKDEVTVIFLPCAHQVVCSTCGKGYEKCNAACPCCGVYIEEVIQVYGASS